MKKILVIEQEEIYLNGIKQLLELQFHQLTVDVTLNHNADLYLSKRYDLVFISYNRVSERPLIESFILNGYKVVLVSGNFQEEMWEDVAYRYIQGFLLADMKTDDFFHAVERLLWGGEYYHPKVLRVVLQHLRRKKPVIPAKPHLKLPSTITRREYDVYRKLVAGYSTEEISEQLHLSESTVGLYISKLLKKTNTKDRVALVLLAIKHQWFDVEIIV